MAALTGRHALVTGGSRGIGRALAAALTQAGATVTATGRDAATLKDTVAQGDAKSFVVADVTDAAAVGAAIASMQHGPVDILIANAGGAESAPFAKADPEQFRRMFELNVMGSVHAIRAVLDGMVARKFGRIVAVASTAGLKGYAYVSAYCAAKHAVVGLVRSLAVETATTGVTVNAVCPGYTDTDMVRESAGRIAAKTGRPADEAVAAMVRNNPLGRLIRPDEVAEAVLFLCSPAAGAITGAALTVAGGEI
jgi:3-hydroxybutyrate dehydrogenase